MPTITRHTECTWVSEARLFGSLCLCDLVKWFVKMPQNGRWMVLIVTDSVTKAQTTGCIGLISIHLRESGGNIPTCRPESIP